MSLGKIFKLKRHEIAPFTMGREGCLATDRSRCHLGLERAHLANADGWMGLIGVGQKNTANERYLTQGINQLALGTGNRVYGAPRTFGVSLAKTF